MGLNSTSLPERIHIGFFGKRNAGKSSIVNAVTGQDMAVVSEVKGTTTDPVYKSMELLPLGPVVIIDTPGVDDEGLLGELRIKKAWQVLNKTDIAVLVVDAAEGKTAADKTLINLFIEKELPYIIVYNKSDLLTKTNILEDSSNEIYVSAKQKTNIYELKEKIAALVSPDSKERRIVGDLISPGDTVLLVVPIDKAAPKGRLILPQQQTIRDLLDSGAIVIVTKETELVCTLNKLKEQPKLVITDSQVFAKVSSVIPESIPLTSFSILFARYKGILNETVKGATALDSLKDGDKVLIVEGCTHHRQCDDIGTVKLPAWIRNFTSKKLDFEFVSGGDFPEDLSKYSLIVHCGGCMLNEREVLSRQKKACEQKIPVTNYGIIIATMTGILKRSLAVFS